MKSNKELVTAFAKTWNNLDSSFIRDLLDPDFHYASQWVLDEIKNKEDYLSYLDKKLQAISNSGTRLIAELGEHENKYCLVLNQIQNGRANKVTFLIETKNGKLLRADTCMIPDPKEIKMLNIIPK
ncbi:hypothetical protein NMK71_07415 [Weeksellaceae bacterium KMM 9713]|uniref:Uncharacterized protein n=1 Tax=Profundicola chukchiensis TaxID=2961959 RepID=A0A9X4MZ21_9FLAO|nr:hypothetical protein [Profundicola chukchiensis]MDG4946237.1 hypothetical protein [Profundicola chukchiensis]